MQLGPCGIMLLTFATRSSAHVCRGVGGALCDETSGYVVVVDAGSSHTAIFAFQYPHRTLKPGNYPVIVDFPLTLPEMLATFQQSPGLSAFVNSPSDVTPFLHKLCMKAKDAILLHIPSVNLKRIPIYLAATAGLRQMVSKDRDKIMQSVRAYLRSEDNPFSFRRNEQARVLSGEEEGAFGWLAVNQLEAQISPNPYTTVGAVDFGGGSVQITFVPSETSILSGFFPMHFGGANTGPLHLYSKSYPMFGYSDSWQRATQHLLRAIGRNSGQMGGTEMDHPCLPSDVTWHVDPGEFGVSAISQHPNRRNGSVALRGTGDFHRCQALAERLIADDTTCYQPPCSLLGVYQPELNHSRFVLFGEHAYLLQWEVTALMRNGHTMLSALRTQVPRLCSLPNTTQRELFETRKSNQEPPCWRGTWMLTFLMKGLHFKEDSADLRTIPGCCEHTLGQALYEINFFPYRFEDVKLSKELLPMAQSSQTSTSLTAGMPGACNAWTNAVSWAAGAFTGAVITAAFFQCARFASAGTGKMLPLAMREDLLRSCSRQTAVVI